MDTKTYETEHPSVASALRRRLHGRTGFVLAAILVAAACNVLFFWQFFFSGFDRIQADLGDGRLCIAFVEHWFHVFKGQEPMASPLYFYPEQGVLGYSEALFLYAVPYAVMRALGSGPFVSFEIALIAVKTIGFASMLLLLRRSFRCSQWIALFGASLFTLSNIYFASAGHVQLAAAAFVPTLLWFGCDSYSALEHGQRRAASWFAAALGMLLALLFITSFYVAWFAVLFFAVFLIITLVVIFARARWSFNNVVTKIWRARIAILVCLIAFAVGLIPFCLIYLPAMSKAGHRTMAEVLYYMPHPIDIVNTGSGNAVWGRLAGRLVKVQDPFVAVERAIGWPLITLVFSFGFGLVEMWRLRSGGTVRDRGRRVVASALALTSALIWIIQIKFGDDFTLWRLMYDVVPGAIAIRVTGRMSLITNVAVVILMTLGIQRLWAHRYKRSLRIAAITLVALTLIEQVNFGSTHNISRVEERHRFASIRRPPKECSSFIAIRSRSGTPIELQTDAITVANKFQIPTMNGYSGWSPPGWDLFTVSDSAELSAARWWAMSRHVSRGACVLDLSSGIWSPSLGKAPEPINSGIEDGGFEGPDLSLWARYQQVRGEVSTKFAHSGKQSLAEVKGEGSFYQDVTGLKPGHTYTVAAWVLGSPDAQVTASIAVYDPVGKVAAASSPVRAISEWRLVTHSFTLANSDAARVARIHLFRNDGPGTLFWDDVKIYESR